MNIDIGTITLVLVFFMLCKLPISGPRGGVVAPPCSIFTLLQPPSLGDYDTIFLPSR